jgi:hypothetical protein
MRTLWHLAGSAAIKAVLLSINTPQLIWRINLFMRAPRVGSLFLISSFWQFF